jgi:hypothetical protein
MTSDNLQESSMVVQQVWKNHGRWWCWWSFSQIFAWFSSILCSYLIYFIQLLPDGTINLLLPE